MEETGIRYTLCSETYFRITCFHPSVHVNFSMILTLSAHSTYLYPHSIICLYFRFASGWVALVQPWLFTKMAVIHLSHPRFPSQKLSLSGKQDTDKTWLITIFDSKCITKKTIRHHRDILFGYFWE